MQDYGRKQSRCFASIDIADEGIEAYERADHYDPEGAGGLREDRQCRKRGISSATFYNWKAKYGGPSVSEAKRLHALAGANTRLNLYADTMRNNAMLEELKTRR